VDFGFLIANMVRILTLASDAVLKVEHLVENSGEQNPRFLVLFGRFDFLQ
jgi:hypothetical protein